MNASLPDFLHRAKSPLRATLLVAAWSNVFDVYAQIWWWDIVVHALCAGSLATMTYLVLAHKGIVPSPTTPGVGAVGPVVLTVAFGLALGAVWEMIEWFGPVIHEYYAGTEGNGFVYTASEDWLAHPGTVGKAIVGTLHVVGDDGQEVPTGEAGTVYFESEAQFSYHNDPDKTAESYLRDGWSTLGDVGHLDEDGFLYLTDRKAYMIITGGVNVYPQEAENVLTMHPAVLDVAVFGVPNDDFGEEVKAVVQPETLPESAEDAAALEAELISFCREHLADVKCPRSVDFREELPRHPTGKLYKRLLKDEYWAAAGRTI